MLVQGSTVCKLCTTRLRITIKGIDKPLLMLKQRKVVEYTLTPGHSNIDTQPNTQKKNTERSSKAPLCPRSQNWHSRDNCPPHFRSSMTCNLSATVQSSVSPHSLPWLSPKKEKTYKLLQTIIDALRAKFQAGFTSM